MFFRRKYRLRNDHDTELIQELETLKRNGLIKNLYLKEV